MSKKVTSKLLKMCQPTLALMTLGGAMLIQTLITPASLAVNHSFSKQDQDESSRRESEAIKAVEAAGGRVYRISAADTTREISFNLASSPITNQQLQGINAIGEVIWMNLAGTEVTNDGLKQLSGLPLKKLHLERTKIGDEGLKHLASMKDLEYLNVYDTKVTDAGLSHLKELKKLKKLYVWKSAVTEAGINKLNQSLPELEIVGELKLKPVVDEKPESAETAEKKEQAKKKESEKEQPPKSDQKKDVKTEPSKKEDTKGKSKDN